MISLANKEMHRVFSGLVEDVLTYKTTCVVLGCDEILLRSQPATTHYILFLTLYSIYMYHSVCHFLFVHIILMGTCHH